MKIRFLEILVNRGKLYLATSSGIIIAMSETGTEPSEARVSTPTEASQSYINSWQERLRLTFQHGLPPVSGLIAGILYMSETPSELKLPASITLASIAGLTAGINVAREEKITDRVEKLYQTVKRQFPKH